MKSSSRLCIRILQLLLLLSSYSYNTTILLLLNAQQDVTLNDDPQDLQHPHTEDCIWTGGACEWDYNMQPMKAQFEQGRVETFYAYVEPHVATFYNQTTTESDKNDRNNINNNNNNNNDGSITTNALMMRAKQPDFQGLFMKFVNLSPKAMQLQLLSERTTSEVYSTVADVGPFQATGTTAYPGNTFQVSPVHKPDKIVMTFTVEKGQHIYSFEPFQGDYAKAYQKLNADDFQHYMIQHNNLLFADQYKAKTNREWLALYGHRFPPRYHMWPAEYIGQPHTISTKEIHFVEHPSQEELNKGISLYGPRPEEITRNRKYRDTHHTLNLTLTVLSGAPRIFEIPHFVSAAEIDHLLEVAKEKLLLAATTEEDEIVPSTTTTTEDRAVRRAASTTKIGRHQSIIMDAIYRRAADVLQIDEKFLRYRRKLEIPEFDESKIGIAESLQLVHHSEGQKHVRTFAAVNRNTLWGK